MCCRYSRSDSGHFEANCLAFQVTMMIVRSIEREFIAISVRARIAVSFFKRQSSLQWALSRRTGILGNSTEALTAL